MKPSLLITLLLLVLLPLGLLAWVGERARRAEQAQLREQLRDVMARRLEDVNRRVTALVEATERELWPVLALVESEVARGLAASSPDAGRMPGAAISTFRDVPFQQRLVQQVFVTDERGRLVFPSSDPAQRSNQEQAFLERSGDIWRRGALGALGAAASEAGEPAASRWQVWFYGHGPRYLFWTNLGREGQAKAGMEVSAAALTADLLAVLPDNAAPHAETMHFTLTDAQDQPLYEWGALPSRDATAPPPVVSAVSLAAPFGAWKLAVAAPGDTLGQGAGTRAGWWTALASAALVLGWLAFYLYRESTRALRDAAQRVTFVNQVSHELKTPLTNIALYAELAERRLETEIASPPLPADAPGGVRECLDIIVAESARLGRLIGNVLTFSKHQHGRLQPRLAPCNGHSVLDAALEPFARSFAEKGVNVVKDLALTRPVQADADWLGQIFANLLSNVEKYAATGGQVRLVSREVDGRVEFAIADRGPGVPPTSREKIFAPFFRVSDRLSDGVAGTGLGLAIARDLAQAMGGSLELQPTTPGAVFVLTLPLSSLPSF